MSYSFCEPQKAYDNYISYLLERQPQDCERLQNDVEQLSGRSTTEAETLKFQSDRLNLLESEAQDLLNENDRLEQLTHERYCSETNPRMYRNRSSMGNTPVVLAPILELKKVFLRYSH